MTAFPGTVSLRPAFLRQVAMVAGIVLCVVLCRQSPALAQGKERAKKKEDVPAWRRMLPNTTAVRQALTEYDEAEAKAKEFVQKARSAATAAEQAQADVRNAIAAKDEAIAAAKQRYAEQFELESLTQQRADAAAESDEASKPVLEELRKTPRHLEKKEVVDEAERARTAAKDAAAETRARSRVSEATQELKKYERKMLDADPRLAEVRGKVEELGDQIAAVKSKIAGLVNVDKAVVAAEAEISQSRIAVGEARKNAKESQAFAAAAETNAALYLEKVQVLARRARDPIRRRDDDNNAKNNAKNDKKN